MWSCFEYTAYILPEQQTSVSSGCYSIVGSISSILLFRYGRARRKQAEPRVAKIWSLFYLVGHGLTSIPEFFMVWSVEFRTEEEQVGMPDMWSAWPPTVKTELHKNQLSIGEKQPSTPSAASLHRQGHGRLPVVSQTLTSLCSILSTLISIVHLSRFQMVLPCPGEDRSEHGTPACKSMCLKIEVQPVAHLRPDSFLAVQLFQILLVGSTGFFSRMCYYWIMSQLFYLWHSLFLTTVCAHSIARFPLPCILWVGNILNLHNTHV